jgi:HK97 family phage major capsid protein
MTSDTLKINRRTGGLTASFTAENAAATESTMSIDQVTLVAKDAMAITRVSGQLNADSHPELVGPLAYEIGYAFANKEDLCGFNGTGTSTYGGITGLVTALTNKWTPGVPGTGVGLIKQGTSNTWATMVMADFDAVVGSLPQYADTNRCVWVMHRTFYYTVVEKLIQAAGGVPAYEVRQGQRAPRPLFKGYPVEFSQVYPSTSDHGAGRGDARRPRAGRRVRRPADGQHRLQHAGEVGGQSMWERNQMGVRGIERFDIVVHDVGDGSAVAGPVIGLAVG